MASLDQWGRGLLGGVRGSTTVPKRREGTVRRRLEASVSHTHFNARVCTATSTAATTVVRAITGRGEDRERTASCCNPRLNVFRETVGILKVQSTTVAGHRVDVRGAPRRIRVDGAIVTGAVVHGRLSGLNLRRIVACLSRDDVIGQLGERVGIDGQVPGGYTPRHRMFHKRRRIR